MTWSRARRWSVGGTLALTLLLGVLPAGAAYASTFTVTAGAATSTLTLGSATALRGKVSPARPGSTVALQQKRGTAWATLMTTKLSDTSRYRFRLAPTSAGLATYRVVKPAQGGRTAGISPTVKLSVYRWIYLADLPTLAQQGVDAWDVDTDITGATFHRSVVLDADSAQASGDGTDGGWFQTDLRGQCSTFKAELGAASGTDAGATAGVGIKGDDSISFSTYFGPTDNAGLTLYITGVKQLEVRGVPTGDAANAALAVGSPRVLCRF